MDLWYWTNIPLANWICSLKHVCYYWFNQLIWNVLMLQYSFGCWCASNITLWWWFSIGGRQKMRHLRKTITYSELVYVDVVNLECRSCSCRRWEVMGIPCSHAMATMKVQNIDPYDYCEHWYQTPMYQMTYSEVLHVTSDRKQWSHTLANAFFPP